MRHAKPARCLLATGLLALGALGAPAQAQNRVPNWESPHVHPLELTPDGARLLAVNTADARLEVFTVAADGSVSAAQSIAVGLDPVSVRARSATEAWVVNHLSDTISIVDLSAGRVVRTIGTGDEPTDVVFAGNPQRAFVSVSQLNQMRVFDLANLGAAPSIIALEGEEPRALAASADGQRVYVGFFESGNATTIVEQADVSAVGGPYGGINPPPNSGTAFSPAIAAGLPAPPPVAQIVRRAGDGSWRDDNNRDWSGLITWNLHDHDVGIIDTATLTATYANSLMTTVMALGVRADGRVAAVGTEALNQIRFEPNVQSIFIRVRVASFDPAAPNTPTIADLNPHLDYSVRSVPQATRNLAIGDPRAIVWHPSNGSAYVVGMGSNNLIVTDANGARLGRVELGQGPTGLALNAAGTRLYALNKFDASISVIDAAVPSELARVSFFDPTPVAIRQGRPLLYDTHASSGLGQIACASCHIDARSDFLAWDLGDPQGQIKTVNQPCRQGPNGCDPWHPMKGPLVTQVLQGIVGNGAMHWRGDRENLGAFAGAFVSLQGADAPPTPTQMQQFETFISNVAYPPNPNRNADGTFLANINVTGGTGNPATGQQIFQTQPTLGPTPCAGCHALPNGTNGQIDDPDLPLAPQSMKVAQLRGLHEKTGWRLNSQTNNKGFGFNSDSEFAGLNALLLAGFNFGTPDVAPQRRRDVEAFMLSFPTETHASVGQQIEFNGANNNDATLTARLNAFIALANAGTVGLVAKGTVGGAARGYVYITQNLMWSDREHQSTTPDALRAAAAPGAEVVFLVVPAFTQYRIGVDRDADGYFDRDEADFGANPAAAASTPAAYCKPDFDGDGTLNSADQTAFNNAFAANDPRANIDHSLGANGLPLLTAADQSAFQTAFAAGCGASADALFGNGYE